MATEIERKFLLCNDDWRREVRASSRMRQAYLGGDRCSIRVRLEGDEANINIKAKVVGPARAEYQVPLAKADAEELYRDLCTGTPIAKTRHFVDFDGLTWEIDEFEDANAGLIVAEVELPSVDHVFARPSWLGEEVTEDARYYNAALAQKPFREW